LAAILSRIKSFIFYSILSRYTGTALCECQWRLFYYSGMNYGFALNKTKNGGGDIASTVQYGHDISL